jgi:tRNA(adenine34) deaminase
MIDADIYMEKVLHLASEALDNGEFPIAAMVVLDDEIISQAVTSEMGEQRFLVHAELIALELADKLQLTYKQRIRGVLYTNLEPCLMCMGAAMSFFLGEIVYGLESPGDGAVELVQSWVRKENDLPGYRVPKIIGGILREESIHLFKAYANRHEAGLMRDWAETLARL